MLGSLRWPGGAAVGARPASPAPYGLVLAVPNGRGRGRSSLRRKRWTIVMVALLMWLSAIPPTVQADHCGPNDAVLQAERGQHVCFPRVSSPSGAAPPLPPFRPDPLAPAARGQPAGPGRQVNPDEFLNPETGATLGDGLTGENDPPKASQRSPAAPAQPPQPAQPAQPAQPQTDDAERRLLAALAGPGRGVSEEVLKQLLSPADQTKVLQAGQRGAAAFSQLLGIAAQPTQAQTNAVNAMAAASAYAAMTASDGKPLFPSLANSRMMQVVTRLGVKAAGGDSKAQSALLLLLGLVVRQDAAYLPAGGGR